MIVICAACRLKRPANKIFSIQSEFSSEGLSVQVKWENPKYPDSE